jgi:mannose-6-phosphate isomerase-like protein (cupin superfamily)
MSKQTRVDRPTEGLGRRAMLERSAAGGAALAAGLFGFGGATEAGAAQLSTGLQQAVTTGRMRRVVSAHDSLGKSFIASDEEVGINELWRTSADQLLGEGPAGEPAPAFRATGASSYYIATIQTSPDPMPTLENRIGFHQTPGVAYVLVLTGEVVYMVDLEEVRLKAGDLVVERGTEHSWRNEGDTPVALLVTVVSAEA